MTFDVRLVGVDAADPTTYLSYLAATVQYDNTILSANPTVLPGPIVPDTSGFIGTGFFDAADAFYDGVFIASTPISQSGTFFSFTVTATRGGSTTLSFSSVAATLITDPDQTNQFVPTATSVDVHVDDTAAVATPAPGGLTLVISGALVCAAKLVRRRNPAV